MKHIVIDARTIDLSTGRYVAQLVGELMRLDNENHYSVIVPSNSREKQRLEAGNMPNNFSFIENDTALFSLQEQVTMPLLLRKLQPDLVHFSFQQTILRYEGKTVITVHDLTQLNSKKSIGNKAVHHIKKQLLQQSIRYAVTHAERVLVPSKYVKSAVEHAFSVADKKVVVTYESGEISRPKNTTPLPDLQKIKYILYVGNARDHKNLHKLLLAFSTLKKTHPDLHLVFVGKKDVYYEKLEREAAKKQTHSVHILGFVSDEELAWLYKHAQAYVFPSLSEGFGLPGLEAMQYDVPVVSSNATCLPEVYQDAAHYFDPTNTTDMAQKIDEVLTRQELRLSLIKNGQRVLKQYSWEKMAKETLAVYEEVLS
jgi:glycosyltransferase involved in cell wall biosynthesis